ncbi:MAG: hypothetical protein CMK59_02000 [Proteobacteria bacterium]|nr:hypothetical protein [Pseudomonadota bacterium]
MLLVLLKSAQAELPATLVEEVDFSKLAYEMVRIPAGEYVMGGEEGLSIERPPHPVMITYDFYMGRYEVDQLLFSVIMGFNPIKYHGDVCDGRIFAPAANEPAYCVSWFEAVRFANLLSRRDGLEECYTVVDGLLYWPNGLECEGYRLPTEAEWEYAARGGEDFIFAGSNAPGEIAWFWENSERLVHPVGELLPNGYGLYDMSGNVWEWCWDWYGDYPKKLQINPLGPALGEQKIRRGGAWFNGPEDIRVNTRLRKDPGARYGILGFRLVRTAPQPPEGWVGLKPWELAVDSMSPELPEEEEPELIDPDTAEDTSSEPQPEPEPEPESEPESE